MQEKHYVIRKTKDIPTYMGYRPPGVWYRIFDPQGVPLVNCGHVHEMVNWLERKRAIELRCDSPSDVTWECEGL